MERRKREKTKTRGRRRREKKNIMFKRLWEPMIELIDPQHLCKTEWAQLNDCGDQAESKSKW